jgi:pimeloyl-ACP methyl ester carboxylesterase
VRYLEAKPPDSVRRRGTLVLVHAFPLNARMWRPQLALAGAGWHVVAPQLRGFDSDGGGDPRAASIDDYAADIIDVLDHLHVDSAVVAGLSMGGYAAFALLRRAPSYVSGLVLADTRAEADAPAGVEARKRMLQLIADRASSAADAVADEMIPKLLGATTVASRPSAGDELRALIRSTDGDRIADAVRVLMTRPDSTPLLGSIHVPTLILVGAEDTLTPPANSESMHRAIAGSELHVISSAGHLSSWEQPDAFNAIVSAFLSHRV